MAYSPQVFRIILVFSLFLILPSCRTTQQEINWMRAWGSSDFESTFQTSVQLGEVHSEFQASKFEDALKESLSSYRLLAAEPKSATHVLHASLTNVETKQEERKVTASVKINYQLVVLQTDKTIVESEIETESHTQSRTDQSLTGAAATKAFLFLLAPLEIMTSSAMGNSLELSIEKAHREATEAAVSKNFKKFLDSLKR